MKPEKIHSLIQEMGLELVNHNHTWSNSLRRDYERVTSHLYALQDTSSHKEFDSVYTSSFTPGLEENKDLPWVNGTVHTIGKFFVTKNVDDLDWIDATEAPHLKDNTEKLKSEIAKLVESYNEENNCFVNSIKFKENRDNTFIIELK